MSTIMPASQDDEIDMISFFRVLWEFKLIIVASVAVFAAGSVVYALSAAPIFEAEVVVAQVGDSGTLSSSALAGAMGGLGSLGSLVGINIGQDGPSQNAQAILKSRYLAERFIEQTGSLAEFSSDAGGSPSLWVGVNFFRQNVLKVREEAAEGVTKIVVTWGDPEVAARWANEYVALANETIRMRARLELERNIAYLNEQIEVTDVVEIERVMYNLLETEIKNLMLANARTEYAFTVLDPAVPPEMRISPRRSLIVLSGCALGGFIGVFIAFAISIFRKVRVAESDRAA